MNSLIALFGESEKGRFHYPYLCTSVLQLADIFGNPPEDSLGIDLAIQALMYKRDILYFRVEEEGYSISDYMIGIEMLSDKNKVKYLDTICIPKVSNHMIIDSLDPICKLHSSLIITTEKDLFDYLISA